MTDKPRPYLVAIEEHHEAFYLWHVAIQNGWIQSSENTLFHVDEHADLALPLLRTPLHALTNISEIKSFTYNELGIGGFIWPAFAKGIFSNFTWIRRDHDLACGKRYAAVWSHNQDPLTLACKISRNRNNLCGNDEHRVVQFEYSDMKSQLATSPQEIILDIDLDYFLSYEAPQGNFQIEITESEYINYESNMYHPFRLLWGQRHKAVKVGDQFFLVAETFAAGSSVIHITNEELALRVDHLCRFLHQHRVVPQLISICRSVKSGFTPPWAADFLETTLVSRLAQMFDPKPILLRDITVGVGDN